MISSGQGIRQSLEHDEATPFPPYIPIRSGIKGLTATVGSKGSHPAQKNGDVWRQIQLHAASESEVALTRAQALTRQMHRHQGRRAGRIERQRGPMQAQDIG